MHSKSFTGGFLDGGFFVGCLESGANGGWVSGVPGGDVDFDSSVGGFALGSVC